MKYFRGLKIHFVNFQFLLAIPLRMSPRPRFMSQRKAKTWFWSCRKQHLELSYQYKSKNVSRCGIRLHETGFRIFENIVISDSHKLSQGKISWNFRKFSNLRWKIWARKRVNVRGKNPKSFRGTRMIYKEPVSKYC